MYMCVFFSSCFGVFFCCVSFRRRGECERQQAVAVRERGERCRRLLSGKVATAARRGLMMRCARGVCVSPTTPRSVVVVVGICGVDVSRVGVGVGGVFFLVSVFVLFLVLVLAWCWCGCCLS